jgi:hypothetical protein
MARYRVGTIAGSHFPPPLHLIVEESCPWQNKFLEIGIGDETIKQGKLFERLYFWCNLVMKHIQNQEILLYFYEVSKNLSHLLQVGPSRLRIK